VIFIALHLSKKGPGHHEGYPGPVEYPTPETLPWPGSEDSPQGPRLVMRLTVRKTNPAAVVKDSALQGDRRAPSTVAAGDESPMNSRQRRVQRVSF